MKRVRTPLVLFAAILASCSSTEVAKQVDTPMNDGPSAGAADEGPDRGELEHKLTVARARLELAELDRSAAEQQAATRIAKAESELEQSQAALALFREAHMPQRIAREELDLQTTKDRAQEAADELAQIEIMYKEQDLDDLTAEFVVSRGRRQAERAQTRIEIAEAAFKALTEQELPQELAKLELAVSQAEAGVAEARVRRELDTLTKGIAVTEARHTVEELAAELADLAGDGQ